MASAGRESDRPSTQPLRAFGLGGDFRSAVATRTAAFGTQSLSLEPENSASLSIISQNLLCPRLMQEVPSPSLRCSYANPSGTHSFPFSVWFLECDSLQNAAEEWEPRKSASQSYTLRLTRSTRPELQRGQVGLGSKSRLRNGETAQDVLRYAPGWPSDRVSVAGRSPRLTFGEQGGPHC